MESSTTMVCSSASTYKHTRAWLAPALRGVATFQPKCVLVVMSVGAHSRGASIASYLGAWVLLTASDCRCGP